MIVLLCFTRGLLVAPQKAILLRVEIPPIRMHPASTKAFKLILLNL